jgi:MscS family membrane protein
VGLGCFALSPHVKSLFLIKGRDVRKNERKLLILSFVLLAGFGYEACAGVADLAKPQTATAQKNPSEESQKVPVDTLGRTTPRGTVTGFLQTAKNNNYEQASHYLDLRGIPAVEREIRGTELAKQLKLVLDRELDIDPSKISDRPEGEELDGFPPSTELLGKVRINGRDYSITLRQIQSGDSSALWFFSDTTVWDIPKMYKLVDYGFIQRFVPRHVLETEFLRIKVVSWIGWALAILASVLTTFFFLKILRAALKLFRTNTLSEYLKFSYAPLFLLIFSLTSRFIMKSFLFFSYEREIYNAATILIFAVTWLSVCTIDYLTVQWALRVKSTVHFANTFVVPSINRAIKLVVIMIGLTIWLSNIGVNITAILTGLGIGGFAVALASQKSIEDLFGAVTILSEKPFKIGDTVKLGDKIGTIQEIDLRYTFLRTLERTVISIPNAQIAAMQVVNFSKRDQFLYHPTVGLRYETAPEQMRAVLEGLRDLIGRHPKLSPDPHRVRFVKMGDYALEIEIFAYFLAADYPQYLELAEDLNLKVMAVVAKCGAEFAFPSQTVYLQKD